MVECNPEKVNKAAVKAIFTDLFHKVKNYKLILITKEDNDVDSLTKTHRKELIERTI